MTGRERAETGQDAPELRLFIFALFFIFGGITSLNDVIIPKLKELFTLTYAQVMLVQSAFFAAYLIVSLPGRGVGPAHGLYARRRRRAADHDAGCLLSCRSSPVGRVRHVPAGAVRAGGGHHHRAGGGQSR